MLIFILYNIKKTKEGTAQGGGLQQSCLKGDRGWAFAA